MIVQIKDVEQFAISNGIYLPDNYDTNISYEVYAVERCKQPLRVLLFIPCIKKLDFVKVDSSIKIISDEINENWIFTKKFKGGRTIVSGFVKYFQPITIKNLCSPKWMVDDREFFLDLIEKPKYAKEKFFNNEENNIIK